MKRLIAVVFWILFAAPLSAQWEASSQAARQQALIGDFGDADKEFQRALTQAKDERTQAQIKIDYAEALSRTSGGRPEEAKLNKQAADLYEAVLPAATGELRVRAANNYGTLLLREEKAEEAVRVLESVRNEPALNVEDEASQARYLYNLGRAYDLSNKPDEARVRYEQSARTDPSFAPAARAVTRIANNQPPTTERLTAEAAWIEMLTERGDLTLSAKALESAFAQEPWREHDAFPHLLRALMSFLTAAKVALPVLQDTWVPRLAQVPNDHVASFAIAKELIAVCIKDLPVAFQPEAARPMFNATLNKLPARPQGPTPQVILSRLLKSVGDVYVEAGQPPKALQRYSLGTAMDLHGDGIDAALYAANLLLGYGKDIDPDDKYLDQLVSRLFDAKGGAYYNEDWDDVLRLHTVLGTIFQERKDWGSEGTVRSAIFQYDRALRAHQRVTATQSASAPVDPLRVRLASSYDGAGRYEDATRTYLDAAQGAIQNNNSPIAREAIEGADRIKAEHSISAEQLARLEALRAKAEDLDPETAPLPSDIIEIPLSEASNRTLEQTQCFRPTNKYMRMVSGFGKIDPQMRVIETERDGHNAPAAIAVEAPVDQPVDVLALICMTRASDADTNDQSEIGKLRFEFADGSITYMPISNVGESVWRQLGTSDGYERTYLRTIDTTMSKSSSKKKLVRTVLVDQSREIDDSRDPGLVLIKLLVRKKKN